MRAIALADHPVKTSYNEISLNSDLGYRNVASNPTWDRSWSLEQTEIYSSSTIRSFNEGLTTVEELSRQLVVPTLEDIHSINQFRIFPFRELPPDRALAFPEPRQLKLFYEPPDNEALTIPPRREQELSIYQPNSLTTTVAQNVAHPGMQINGIKSPIVTVKYQFPELESTYRELDVFSNIGELLTKRVLVLDVDNPLPLPAPSQNLTRSPTSLHENSLHMGEASFQGNEGGYKPRISPKVEIPVGGIFSPGYEPIIKVRNQDNAFLRENSGQDSPAIQETYVEPHPVFKFLEKFLRKPEKLDETEKLTPNTFGPTEMLGRSQDEFEIKPLLPDMPLEQDSPAIQETYVEPHPVFKLLERLLRKPEKLDETEKLASNTSDPTEISGRLKDELEKIKLPLSPRDYALLHLVYDRLIDELEIKLPPPHVSWQTEEKEDVLGRLEGGFTGTKEPNSDTSGLVEAFNRSRKESENNPSVLDIFTDVSEPKTEKVTSPPLRSSPNPERPAHDYLKLSVLKLFPVEIEKFEPDTSDPLEIKLPSLNKPMNVWQTEKDEALLERLSGFANTEGAEYDYLKLEEMLNKIPGQLRSNSSDRLKERKKVKEAKILLPNNETIFYPGEQVSIERFPPSWTGSNSVQPLTSSPRSKRKISTIGSTKPPSRVWDTGTISSVGTGLKIVITKPPKEKFHRVYKLPGLRWSVQLEREHSLPTPEMLKISV